MNKNIMLLARLYDAAAHELHKALAAQTVTYNDPRIRDKVVWLGDIAKTLSLVYQIETLRTKNQQGTAIELPEQQKVEDPAVKKAQQNQFNPGNPAEDLDSFGGGWKPF
jgi:hypothetical protein